MNLTPRCYLWVITIFLFTCILSGGTLLLLYMMTEPETPTTSWYPFIGILLVCLPWFFWLLTVLYRILSRTLGFRMVCWGSGVFPINSTRRPGGDAGGGGGGGGGGDDDGGGDSTLATAEEAVGGPTNGGSLKQVHFDESVGQGSSSHESELPLKSSMVAS